MLLPIIWKSMMYSYFERHFPVIARRQRTSFQKPFHKCVYFIEISNLLSGVFFRIRR